MCAVCARALGVSVGLCSRYVFVGLVWLAVYGASTSAGARCGEDASNVRTF